MAQSLFSIIIINVIITIDRLYCLLRIKGPLPSWQDVVNGNWKTCCKPSIFLFDWPYYCHRDLLYSNNVFKASEWGFKLNRKTKAVVKQQTFWIPLIFIKNIFYCFCVFVVSTINCYLTITRINLGTSKIFYTWNWEAKKLRLRLA